jgi:two-component system, cell cycle sensor histidine kinase and response regulator CckA
MSTRVLEETQASRAATLLRALILEEVKQDIESILSELKRAGYDVVPTIITTRAEFREALARNSYDVVLSDHHLSSWSGLQALAELRNVGDETPFVIISATLGDEAAVECIKQGASDYVLKEHISRLSMVLHRALTERALRDENTRATQALRVSEARNRVLKTAIYGIAHISDDGALLEVNPAFHRILGCSDSVDGNHLKYPNLANEVFRFPEQYTQLMAACREKGQVDHVEAEWRRCDGGIVTVRLHLRRLTPHNDSREFELTVEDVTELRAIERQLQQAQKFEAVGQLAGGVAHDFNNVIGAILGWAELGIEQSKDHPAVVERFGRIRDQAERAAGLTRELLAFARRQVLQPRTVDLNTVATELVSLLDKVIGKDIDLKLVSAPLDTVKADPTHIEQVLMTLCLNARDAMPQGGRLIVETEMVELDEPYCRFYPYVTPGRYAVVSVSDTGVGMDAETRERIFEPFFTTKERGKGTGLGLATVYGIVKQHGGFLHVYSEPAHGSLFRVYLPAAADVQETPNMGATAAGAPSRSACRGTETILLADDHESIREMSRQTLSGLGYRILAACDGEEALRLCEGETPALAILDVVMPKVGGVAAAAALEQRFAGMPILFTSGYSAAAGGIPSESSGRRYLQKPYSPTTLAHIVREMLDAQSSADTTA